VETKRSSSNATGFGANAGFSHLFNAPTARLGIEYAPTWEVGIMEQIQRCEPSFAFIASAELLEENSGTRLSSRISDLSLNGCYVDTVNPLPDGSLVHLRIFTETHSFEAPATVVHSQAFMGMGMKFREVQPKFEEVLRLWLPEATERAKEAHG
jgi:hypothetical protein